MAFKLFSMFVIVAILTQFTLQGQNKFLEITMKQWETGSFQRWQQSNVDETLVTDRVENQNYIEHLDELSNSDEVQSSASRAAPRMILSHSIPILSDEFINQINQLNTTWQAGRNFDENHSLKSLRSLMGTRVSGSKLTLFWHENTKALPRGFDARKKWRQCSTIDQIRDQGLCGSCWVFAAVEAMSDRICIHSRGKVNVELSAEDVVSCCRHCGGNDGGGCINGYTSAAWMYYLVNGIVTGGPYGSKKGCQPYEIKPCGKFCDSSVHVPTPACSNQCQAGYNVSYLQDKHYAERIYNIPNDEKQIMKEIITNGPVEASFTVYNDFYQYQSGIYQRHSDVLEGHHAIRILGWGVRNKVKYWLCANSWGTNWGARKGYFKIRRGVNECGIESDIIAGLPE